MGSGSSTPWKGYKSQLFDDTTPQTYEVPGTEEVGATAIRRNFLCKKGFCMYLKASDIPSPTSPPANTAEHKTKDEYININNSNLEVKVDDSIEMNTGWICISESCRKFSEYAMFGYRPFTAPMVDVSKRGKYEWDTYATGLQQMVQCGNGMNLLYIQCIQRCAQPCVQVLELLFKYNYVHLQNTKGLRNLGIEDKSNIGIFSMNRPEWMVAHVANWSQNYRTVALYDTLGAQAVQYIIWHASLVAIYVEKNKLPALFDAIRSCSDERELKLQFIVQFDFQKRYNNEHEFVDEKDIQTAQAFGIKLLSFTDLLENDAENEAGMHNPSPEDLAYIMYTSGTTGDPKGVQLTHQSFACTVGSAYRGLSNFGDLISNKDVHCSYLPLAHSFEAAVITCILSGGGQVAFWAGNIKKIAEDWKELRPTLMFGVPRIYNKTYDKVEVKVQAGNAGKKWLFHKAKQASMSNIRSGERNAFFDALVWKNVAAEIGFDRVRVLASGAAPLPPHVAEFLRVVCNNAVIAQGYGLTETCAVSFFTQASDLTLGHVGIPVDNIEYRLVDAPECEYFANDKPYPRGEIQLRGPTLMTGYFRNEEATEKVLAKDGWFSTGDIGRINPNGTLSIIDRRKNMFKTAMGEYIAAEKVELVYLKASAVNQMWIYGNSFKSFVIAVLVPDALWLVPLLKENGCWVEENLYPATPEYCAKFKTIVDENYDLVKDLCLTNLRDLEAESDLMKFEKIRDILIEFDLDELLQGFNVDNDCLTPTFKMKRPQLLKRYKEQIMQMYAENGEPSNEDENW